MNAGDAGAWSGNWAWSLPLIVLNTRVRHWTLTGNERCQCLAFNSSKAHCTQML